MSPPELRRKSRAAYAVFEDDTIVPIGSDAERETLARAFADVAASEFNGARMHLRNAGSELMASNYGPSIRESIHAVEAVARVLEPGAQTLGPARRCETQATLGGKPPSSASVSVP